MTGDGGKLTNSNAFATLTNARVPANNTNSTFQQLANDVQTAVDNAAIAAGITPGFLVSGFMASGATFPATAVPFGAPNFISLAPAPAFGGMTDGMRAQPTPLSGAIDTILPDPGDATKLFVGTLKVALPKTPNPTN